MEPEDQSQLHDEVRTTHENNEAMKQVFAD